MSAQHVDLVKAIDTVKDMVGRLSTEPDALPILQRIKVSALYYSGCDNMHAMPITRSSR